ncbi:hypothetical protein NHX12_030133 [Muraenolepis orangiensis]|uniref:Uncharacterized protein n=1 Tax=Muraenolepis orangiensis TaxID=630683 RepID=A0A9Q0E782_9TELE|nr:hypothetical protein NHX12_030133 [Muraenolepis orangiensis]
MVPVGTQRLDHSSASPPTPDPSPHDPGWYPEAGSLFSQPSDPRPLPHDPGWYPEAGSLFSQPSDPRPLPP